MQDLKIAFNSKGILNIKKGPTLLKKYKAGQIRKDEFGKWIESMKVKSRKKIMLINVNNINITIIYEVFGQGSPIILPHDNGENFEIFDKLIEKLQTNYMVYEINSRCHGKIENTKKI